MNILVLGATGTAGSGILRACLASPAVRDVRVIARRPPAEVPEKLTVCGGPRLLEALERLASELERVAH